MLTSFKKIVCFNLLLLLMATSLTAQEQKRISCNFKSLPFKQFVDSIEATTPFYFYYDARSLDSFTVTIDANRLTLQELLQKVFTNTAFYYNIDAANHVFITTRFPILNGLPTGFFNKTNQIKDSLSNLAILIPSINRDSNKANVSKENVYEIGTKTSNQKGNVTISGYVRYSATGEPIAGAAVSIDSLSIGAITNQFGYYIFSLPRGKHTLQISSAGMQEGLHQLLVHNDGKLDLEMKDFIPSLKTVVVLSGRNTNTKGLLMGVNRLQMPTIKKVPVVFGETDVLRVILTLPGVTSAGEASTGFNVRGGSADQNLILFSEATIYNPSHLFGFFSAFNPDVIKGVELYKSGIPQKYGGRLSSVLDLTTKEGNATKLSGAGGIGLLTSKLTLEGPLVKDKTTFLLGGRTTYSNWLLKKVVHDNYKNSKASFYDVNLHINHTLNKKNNVYLTGYISNDNFRLNQDTLYEYGNANFNIKWKHIFTNRMTSVFTAGLDHYRYGLSSNQNPVNAFDLSFKIQQLHFRSDFNYAVNNKHQLNFGFNSIYYQLQPGSFTPNGVQSLVQKHILDGEQALESALYFGDAITLSPKFALNAGLRFSMFNYLGPRNVQNYLTGFPRQENTITDTTIYTGGKIIKTYLGPEYRVSLRYALTGDASVKMSFNSLRQYIHMLSNTNAISPTDIWKLSDPNIKPQQGYQVSLGYYKNFKSNTIETSFELYYKTLKHYLDYKSGAKLIMNPHIETDVLNAKGKAYGAEILIKKETGKLNGWVSYTYSRTWLKTDDPIGGERINNGAYYPANFDKPHNLNIITNFRFSHRFSLSFNTIYNTGRPLTLPLAVFNQGGGQRLYYSQRNEYRVPDYFRSDISLMLEGNHKIKKLAHSSWSLGVYNLTGRENAYSVYFIQENGSIKGYQLSIFGVPIPFITYNFKF